MKSILKKSLAVLLVFSFVFAFAACKKDDGETTTATETTVGDATTADDATTAVDETTDVDATTDVDETTALDDTTAAPGETTTAAVGLKMPIGGNMAQVIGFYNEYGNAAKSYKGSVKVTKKSGTTSKITAISPEMVRGQAEKMLPNDYKEKPTYTFVNGTSTKDDKKLSSWLIRDKSTKLSEISPTGDNGVKSATCVASGSGCKITIVMKDDITSGPTALNDTPKYVSKSMDTLDLKADDLKPFKLKDATVNYTGCKIEAVFDAQGRLIKLDATTPANIVGNLSLAGINIIKADIVGTYKANYTLTY